MWRYKRNYKKQTKPEDFMFWFISAAVLWIAFKLQELYKQNNLLFIVIIIGLFSLIWYIIYYIKKKEREKLLGIETIEDMMNMNWREFEKYISFVLKERGYKSKTRRWTKDGWIDVEATYQWRKYLIQCKQWNKKTGYKITLPNIREFYWAIMSYDKNAKWIYVTTANLTKDAEIFAKNHDIEVWDVNNLERNIASYLGKDSIDIEKNNSINTIQEINKIENIKCEKCWSDMILRTATRWKNQWNQFYGCSNFPKCRNIKNI